MLALLPTNNTNILRKDAEVIKDEGLSKVSRKNEPKLLPKHGAHHIFIHAETSNTMDRKTPRPKKMCENHAQNHRWVCPT